MNEYLATLPFDLYELSLFHLVVKHRSFTRAAELAGLTQSAITRQMQGLEDSLGLDLLERTTRSVRVTSAGEFLFRESIKLLGDVDQSLRRLKEDFGKARKEVRIGVSRSVTLSHLPGLFHANLRRSPLVNHRVTSMVSSEILSALEANDLDVGVMCSSPRVPKTLAVTHRFADAFTLISSRERAAGFPAATNSPKARLAWLENQPWLMIDPQTNTGALLDKWLRRAGMKVEPTMRLDNFDLIITLAALGLGISIVPIRALALHGRRRSLVRLRWPDRFTRELVVIVRRHRQQPEHLRNFVANILFG
jgi:DNA-binding transcriptional LysR family regulator